MAKKKKTEKPAKKTAFSGVRGVRGFEIKAGYSILVDGVIYHFRNLTQRAAKKYVDLGGDVSVFSHIPDKTEEVKESEAEAEIESEANVIEEIEPKEEITEKDKDL